MEAPTPLTGLTVHPRSEPGSGRQGLLWPALSGVAGLAAAGALFLRDPHQQGSWGTCPFLALTGWYCPLCGGLRATYDALHLRWTTALHENALALMIDVVAVLAWAWWLRATLAGRRVDTRRLETRTAALVGAAVLIAFTVLRNTVLPGLAPA